jgi:hypothetical protein
MTPAEFIRTRPCLEEIDGYLAGLRAQLEDPENFPEAVAYTTDVMQPIEEYRKRLMAGKVMPMPAALERGWVYRQGKKPVRAKAKAPPPETEWSPIEDAIDY